MKTLRRFMMAAVFALAAFVLSDVEVQAWESCTTAGYRCSIVSGTMIDTGNGYCEPPGYWIIEYACIRSYPPYDVLVQSYCNTGMPCQPCQEPCDA